MQRHINKPPLIKQRIDRGRTKLTPEQIEQHERVLEIADQLNRKARERRRKEGTENDY